MVNYPIASDERQRRINERLERLVGPGTAAFFIDACRIMDAYPSFRAQTHLVAHCLREIESAMRDVMTTVSSREEDRDNGVGGSHRANVEAILVALNEPESGSLHKRWLGLLDNNLYKYAHRRRLGPARSVDEHYHYIWERAQQVFDEALSRFVHVFAGVTDELDRLLKIEQPTTEDAKILAEKVPFSTVAHRYFFDRLEHPNWIPILSKKGLFDFPPSAEVDPETGGISFPPWAASTFLKRVASEAPEKVFDAMSCVPKTDNQFVFGELASAAANLPSHLAAQWTDTGIDWLKTQDCLHFNVPDDFSVLATHLAANEEEEAALRLMRVLLDVQSAETQQPDISSLSDSEFSFPLDLPEPRTRLFHDFDYKSILDRVVPELLKAAHIETLKNLCELLEKCIDLSLMPDEKEIGPPYDGSSYWCSSIAPDEDGNTDAYRPKQSLVETLREASLRVIDEHPGRLSAILELLRNRKYDAFQRIALHILCVVDDPPLALVQASLLKRRFFDDDFWPEYAALLRDKFVDLPSDDQEMILGWIEDGPDITEDRNASVDDRGKGIDQGRVDVAKRPWHHQRLDTLEGLVPQQWKEAHSYLFKQETGPIEPSRAEVSIQETRSLVKEHLENDLESLGALLRQWPSLEHAPNMERLGVRIKQSVKQSPNRFADAAKFFKGTDATFVKNFFMGLGRSLESGASFSWKPVLELGLWAVDQPREIEGRTQEEWLRGKRNADPHWGRAWGALVELLGRALAQRGDKCIDYQHSEKVWQILEALASDPELTPLKEKVQMGRNLFNQALNTTHGQVMIAVMEYVRWKWSFISEQGDSDGSLENPTGETGLAAFPEVAKVLTLRLDPSGHPSPVIHAVYGYYFPDLAHIDQAWAQEYKHRIFPDGPEHRALFQAAWVSYVSSTAYEAKAFNIALDIHSRAINELEPASGDAFVTSGDLSQPFSLEQQGYLAERLMRLYVGGHLELEDVLLEQFFDVARDELRGRAIRYVGELLKQCIAPEYHPTEFERCRKLWEKRLCCIKEKHPKGNAKDELGAFGNWFTSGKVGHGEFSTEWALEQLEPALNLGGKPERPPEVIEALERVSVIDARVVRCIEFLLDGNSAGQLARYKVRELRAIFQHALQEDESTAEVTRALINRLLSRGIAVFRDLL